MAFHGICKNYVELFVVDDDILTEICTYSCSARQTHICRINHRNMHERMNISMSTIYYAFISVHIYTVAVAAASATTNNSSNSA